MLEGSAGAMTASRLEAARAGFGRLQGADRSVQRREDQGLGLAAGGESSEHIQSERFD